MAKLKIAQSELVIAFSSSDPTGDAEWYLDRRTGEVVLITQDWFDAQDVPDWQKVEVERWNDIEKNPECYLQIEPLDASEDFETMAAFVRSLADSEKAKPLLSDALRASKPFKHFRECLNHYPKVESVWFRFRDAKLVSYVKEWLQLSEIDAELVDNEQAAK